MITEVPLSAPARNEELERVSWGLSPLYTHTDLHTALPSEGIKEVH